MSARVVLLNGVSSVGKGSVATALQRIVSRPMLHVQMDAFMEMMPPGSFGSVEGYAFATREEDGKPVTAITSGELLAATLRAMRAAVGAMAEAGSDLVLDEVMWDRNDLEDYRRRLAGHAFHTVGLIAPLEVIEARETARGDRTLGLARWQYDKVHAGMDYDLTIDTSRSTPDESATVIKRTFGL